MVATLGKGGFGTVYRARFLGQGGFTKQVAIKVLNENMEDIDEVAQRLRDEARMLGLLNHRAIVRVDRLAQFDGRWAVIMEYIEGLDLKELVAARGGVPVGVALECVAEVASAIHSAFYGVTDDGQQLGVVHRDIKPENIFLTTGGEVKVLDFGIARANFSGREAATQDISFGSPDYMSPERFDLSRDDREDPPSDVYSLGCVLFELITGRSFGRTSPLEKRHQKNVEKAYNALRSARAPEQVLRLVAAMVAYDPADRPTAREVERACIEIKNAQGDEILRYWAEREVPKLRVDHSPIDDGMTGTILVERADSIAQGNVPAGLTGSTTSGTRALTRTTVVVGSVGVLAMGVVVVLLLIVLGVVLWQVNQPAPGELAAPGPEVVEEPVEPTEVAQPEVTEPAQTQKEPQQVEPVRTQVRTPQTRTEPAVVEPPPEEATEEAPVEEGTPDASGNGATASPQVDLTHAATVTVAGDADSVVFIGAKGRVAVPGKVPAGRYTLGAVFGAGRLQQFGSVDVMADQQITVRCDGLLMDCVAH